MTKQNLLMFVFAVVLSGCSAKVEGGDPAAALGGLLPTPAPETFEHLVADAPVVDGIWQSGCVENTRGDGYMSVRLTITGQDVSRDTNLSDDATCAKVVQTKTEIGQFRYKALNSVGGLEVEYRFQMDIGGWYTQYEVFMLQQEEEVLWISGLIGGEASPNIPMVNIGIRPLPIPTPVPTPAE